MRLIKQFLKRFKLMRAIHALIYPERALQAQKAKPAALEEIEARTVSPNATFERLHDKAQTIDGMLSRFSMAVLDMLLAYQRATDVRGDIIEIGIYKGKSAVILGNYLNPGERLTLVDVQDILDRDALAGFENATDLLITDSGKLPETLPDFQKRLQSFRLIHIDASHGFHETYRELEIAEQLLAPRGVIALDDFANLDFSQNIAAIFRYLFCAPTNLVLFLVTDEKGYMCRKEDAETYLSYTYNWALAEMQSRGLDTSLARTCYESEYRAFYLRRRRADETGFYGPKIYRNRIIGS
jgi:predicted O-methyltransferase YrrM